MPSNNKPNRAKINSNCLKSDNNFLKHKTNNNDVNKNDTRNQVQITKIMHTKDFKQMNLKSLIKKNCIKQTLKINFENKENKVFEKIKIPNLALKQDNKNPKNQTKEEYNIIKKLDFNNLKVDKESIFSDQSSRYKEYTNKFFSEQQNLMSKSRVVEQK
jgi:hypothetical protein